MIHWPTTNTGAHHGERPTAVVFRHTGSVRGALRALVPWIAAVSFFLMLAVALGAQPPAAASSPDSTAAPRRVIRSWTSDRRDFAVGDIITVTIYESTDASANTVTNNTDSKRRSMDAGLISPTGVSPSIHVGSSNDGSTTQQGDATRGTRFAGEMSVRVVAVTKEGNLQVKGMKVVDVDKNGQEMTLTGFVRPSDVSSRDVVPSSRVADLQLVYTAKGSLGKAKTGLLTRILGVFWP